MLFLALACMPKSLEVGTDTGSAAVDDSSEPAAPEADFSQYTSSVHWSYDTWGEDYDCEDDMVETGEAVTDEDDLEALQAACALCDHFYVANFDKEAICDYSTTHSVGEDYRGFVLDDDAGVAQVYRFDESDGDFEPELLDGGATWDPEAFTITFSGSLDWYGTMSYDVELAFPVIE